MLCMIQEFDMTFSFRRTTAALVALALAAGTMAAQAQTSAASPADVVPEPGVVVSGGVQVPAYAAVYPAPVYAAPAYAAPVAYVQAPSYYIDPVATVLTAVGVGLLFGVGGHHGPAPRRW
jgi:hypothetical protein